MAETALCDALIKDFTENYIGKVFYYCLRRTSDSHEAEDLASDIAVNIFSALNKGTVPKNFSAWVWQIAKNRYSVWADRTHRGRLLVAGTDITAYEDENSDLSVEEEFLHAEQLAALRRELAFISSDYRGILIAYYFENRKVQDIADSLGLTKSTVESRLFRARKTLKEGMDMERKFGKRSYNPEQVTFVMNGRDGKRGQPWAIITHLLYKNIFLETCENPQTAKALSLELGIALPYMEDELEFLVREQLLTKIENKYQTAFPIISKEEQRKKHDNNKKIQKALTDKICALIDTYINEDGSKVNYNYIGYEAAKWAIIVRAFDWLQYAASKSQDTSENHGNSCPARPDDGAWTLTGHEAIDWEEPPFVGKHGYFSYDKNEMKQDIDFGQFKFYYNNIQAKTPMHLSWMEAYTLWLVCSGRIEVCEKGYLEKLMEYGYLKKDETIIPNLVIFDRDAEKPYNESLTAKLASLRDEIYCLFIQAPDMERGYIVEQALEDGWLKYDDHTINTIGAYIYL